MDPPKIPNHNKETGMGIDVTFDKKGKGIVREKYKVNKVILIKGEIRKTKLVDFKSRF
jgi:hypothetical protein